MKQNKDNTDTLKNIMVYLTHNDIKVLVNLLNQCPDDDCETLLTKLKDRMTEETLDVFDVKNIWNLY